MTLLGVRDLSRSFEGVTALEDVTFDVSARGVHSIIGPNGAGKTTLFNLVTGLYRPTRGRVFLSDADVTGAPPSAMAARGLSRTFQNLQIFFNMTALENVMVGAHLHSDRRLSSSLFRLHGLGQGERASADRARTLMAEVGLDAYAGSPAAAMPYGALKRLEIARALASKPKLLLLDEPAAGLNLAETAAIGKLIRKIAESGVTVLLVEHNMRLVMDISDRVLVLDRGQLLADGTADEVRVDPQVVRAYLGTRAGEARGALRA
jgi:branched-chain amino acid transport system ATP-binding protein